MHSGTVVLAMPVHRSFDEANIVVAHANGRKIVALRFAGHRTIEMLALVASKV